MPGQKTYGNNRMTLNERYGHMNVPINIVGVMGPVLMGCVAEALGVDDAMMIGIAVSSIWISVAAMIMVWELAGLKGLLSTIGMASVFTLGVSAAMRHDDQQTSRKSASSIHDSVRARS